jgi:hypothetical protein
MAGEFSPSNSVGINFSYLNDKVGGVVSTNESSLKARLDSLGPNATQAELIDIQMGVQKWTMSVQLQSTLNQTLSEALKGIIQKSA